MTISLRVRILSQRRTPLEPAQFAVEMELRSNPETLCAVRARWRSSRSGLGFSEPECRAVVLGVDEALTNIIRHAYAGTPTGPSKYSSAAF